MAHLTAAALVESGALPPRALEACVECLRDRGNLLVTGVAGAGKTVLMHALAELLPADERLLALDAADELRLARPQWERIELRRDLAESPRRIAARALQAAPCRLVVGNLCPPETGEILQAMLCRWQAGSLIAVGAGSADEALRRLTAWAVLDGFTMESASRTLAELIDLAVCVRREPDGSRRIEAARVAPTAAGGWSCCPA